MLAQAIFSENTHMIEKKLGERLALILLFLIPAISFIFMGLGIWSVQNLPIDAVPDVTNVQVQINVQAAGYTPLEVEQRITVPIETAITGLPGLEYRRSLSRYGLSQVTVVFEEGLLECRQPLGHICSTSSRLSSLPYYNAGTGS